MREKNKKNTRRIRSLMLSCALLAIIVAVSTYAWFIGMQKVEVNSFDIKIAGTESLMLSLDGETWSSTLNIADADWSMTKNDGGMAYDGNTNTWGGAEGLIPVSTVGVVNETSSRLELYEKASLTPTPGGYRLLASQIENSVSTDPEPSGYVAFDLFIRNYSGRNYIPDLDPLDEEAIYLTVDSSATVSLNGIGDEQGIPGTGIENSVRVAFAQIGRVIGTETDATKITDITCANPDNTDATLATGICRTARIWEPNDRDHVQAAINWYDKSCKARTDESTYAGACSQVADGLDYPTYAVAEPIIDNKYVDVYDGDSESSVFNGYAAAELMNFPYFTDSHKLLRGVARPEFMSLAPNSITKVRVYVFIEGQDIDNYDFAQIGKKISINFGFTKERFVADDINYTGPDMIDTDGRPVMGPIIELNPHDGTQTDRVVIQEGDPYTDAGVVLKKQDGTVIPDQTELITINKVNHDVPGTYLVVYKYRHDDILATRTRTVVVVADATP